MDTLDTLSLQESYTFFAYKGGSHTTVKIRNLRSKLSMEFFYYTVKNVQLGISCQVLRLKTFSGGLGV